MPILRISSMVTLHWRVWVSKTLDQARTALDRLAPHPEVPRDGHQRDHRQVLVDRGDAGVHGVARTLEGPWACPRTRIEPFGGFVNPRHGFDEGRLAGTVVAEQAVALSRSHVEADAGQRDDVAEVLFDRASIWTMGSLMISAPPSRVCG